MVSGQVTEVAGTAARASGAENDAGVTTTDEIAGSRAQSQHDARAIQQATAIPGPQSQMLQAEREQYLPRGVFTYHPVYPAAGSGARLTDVDGNTYLDFAGGIGVMNIGHSHPDVVAAIQAQAALYT
ncbi:MAG: aminotransferase class III-fold pyridoxal phosphate-dependent enzyme, partial [Ktedonobacterales bacterium]